MSSVNAARRTNNKEAGGCLLDKSSLTACSCQYRGACCRGWQSPHGLPRVQPPSRAAMWSCRQGSRLLDIPWPSAGLAGLHAAEREPSWIGRGLPQPLAPQPSSTTSIHMHKHTHGHESTSPAQPARPLLPRQPGFGHKNQKASIESTSIRAF